METRVRGSPSASPVGRHSTPRSASPAGGEHEDDLVGVVLPDSAESYLSTALFEDESVPVDQPDEEPANPAPDAE